MAAPALPVPLLQSGAVQAVLEGYYLQDASTPAIASGDQATSEIDGETKAEPPIPFPLPTKPVPLPVDKPTKSFWTHSPGANEFAREGAEGELVRDADVVVIGSGLTGISAAYHLAKKLGETLGEGEGKRVVVLEARDFCSGATGRNGGHLFPNPFFGFLKRQALYGTEAAIKTIEIEQYTMREVFRILHDTNTAAEADLVEDGRITLLVTPQEEELARADYEAAKQAGVPDIEFVKWIDRETMAKIRGTAHPGVWAPSGNLWPLKLVAQLYKLAKASSSVEVSVHTHTPATAVHSNDGARRYTVETPRGPIQCDYVVHATNGYTNYLVDPKTTNVRVVPTRGQVIAVPADVGTEKMGTNAWTANERYEYWFPRPVKEVGERPLIILGGAREVAKPNFGFYETDDGIIDDEVGSVLRKFLPSLFPKLFDNDTKPIWEWTGIMGFTATGNPYVGRLPAPDSAPSHQYIAAGYTGHGMPRTYACAEVVAGWIAADIVGTEWTAPSWFPRHYEWNRQ
ncbi:FAD dependent oxidoreductase-domain-containing protein [Ephemerocybe angulata]|uniref:FAD dependent oxidoreductase-domain-containing protein n=1 Tax=Ephemerocybe angulata TaxID=980116 RepID=A0A8H6M868_9AGAR|nr:FAD dependent oxidoreductase-domain-containing protein [Tulosesus angulatus]